MKQILDNYTFSKGPADSGTITMTDLASTGIEPERLLLISNVTKGVVIYNFADPNKRYASVSSNVLTLHYDTSSMSNTDKLQIIYEFDDMSPNVTTVSGEYNSTLPTLNNGDKKNFQLDNQGRLVTSEGTLRAGENLVNDTQSTTHKPTAAAMYSPSFLQNAAAATTLNVKASPGSATRLRVSNSNAAVRYFQIHNATSAPASGATPYKWFVLPAGSTTNPYVLDTGEINLYCSVGISWTLSTAPTTYTPATAGDHLVSVDYV